MQTFVDDFIVAIVNIKVKHLCKEKTKGGCFVFGEERLKLLYYLKQGGGV